MWGQQRPRQISPLLQRNIPLNWGRQMTAHRNQRNREHCEAVPAGGEGAWRAGAQGQVIVPLASEQALQGSAVEAGRVRGEAGQPEGTMRAEAL